MTSTVTEESPCAPINPYGESKFRAEKILLDLAEQKALRPVILRYFNVAGADPMVRAGYRLEENPSHLIRACLTAALHDRPFTLNGTDFQTPDGSCIRDYIHVTDLANAHIKALEYLRGGGEPRIFNCGNGKGVSNLEVIAAVEKVIGKKMQVIRGPRREGDPAALTSDASKIQRELGWHPEYTDIEVMVRHQLAWVRSQMQDVKA
jgi:UDP-glucose 4-epimerase